MLKTLLHTALAWLMPQACCVCNRLADVWIAPDELLDLCKHCLERIVSTKNRCFACAKRLNDSGVENIYCASCQDFTSVIYQTVAACDYRYPVSKLVKALSFGDRKCIAKILAFLVQQKLASQTYELPRALVALPLYPWRESLHGYSPAREIAAHLGSTLKLPVLDQLCWRIKDTKPQFALSRAQRVRNMAGAFAVNSSLATSYPHVAIVTDLVYSGATVRSLARALAKTSIERIDVWCVCHI